MIRTFQKVSSPIMVITRKLRLILIFSRRFLIPAFCMTALFCGVSLKYGTQNAQTLLFVLKILSSILIGYLTPQYRKNEFYFYYNFHLTPLVLLVAGLILDFMLFAVLIPYCF